MEKIKMRVDIQDSKQADEENEETWRFREDRKLKSVRVGGRCWRVGK